jgi:hypothetical protein
LCDYMRHFGRELVFHLCSALTTNGDNCIGETESPSSEARSDLWTDVRLTLIHHAASQTAHGSVVAAGVYDA